MSAIFDIQENTDNIVLIHKESKRSFNVYVDTKYKFSEYGFGKLNAREIVYQKVKSFDFDYFIDRTSLELNFVLSNHCKIFYIDMSFPEIVIENDKIIDLFNESRFSKEGIQMILNRINYLEEKVFKLSEELKEIHEQENEPYIY
jgi:hypothetical protein